MITVPLCFFSVRWKILLQFQCRNRLLLTGTPIQNTMAEVGSVFLCVSVFMEVSVSQTDLLTAVCYYCPSAVGPAALHHAHTVRFPRRV